MFLIIRYSTNKLQKHCVTKNCSELSLFEQNFANTWPSALSFFRSLEQFFLTVGQKILVTKYHFAVKNLGNKGNHLNQVFAIICNFYYGKIGLRLGYNL